MDVAIAHHPLHSSSATAAHVSHGDAEYDVSVNDDRVAIALSSRLHDPSDTNETTEHGIHHRLPTMHINENESAVFCLQVLVFFLRFIITLGVIINYLRY